jgi:HSP20 family molecular chaperone IbpA
MVEHMMKKEIYFGDSVGKEKIKINLANGLLKYRSPFL